MLYTSKTINFTVVQLGNVDRSYIANTIEVANATQHAFHFELIPERVPLDQIHKLPNSSYELDVAVAKLIQNRDFPRPLVFVTSAPFGATEYGNEPDWFFFSEHTMPFDPKIS